MISYYTLVDKLRGALKSLVVWFNSTVALAVPALDYAQQQIPLLYNILPTNLYGWSFGLVVALNVLLRFRTRTALEYKA